MSQFGSVKSASERVQFTQNAAAAGFGRDKSTGNCNWLRPGYYLMRLRQYYRKRSRSTFLFTESFLSPQEIPE